MPTPSIPSGYAVVSCVFSVDGTIRTPTITMALRLDTLTTAPALNTLWRNALTGTNCPYIASTIPSTMQIEETRVLLNAGGSLFSDVDVTTVLGTSSVQAPPINTAILINKVTGLAGRKFRGRLFSPCCFAESSVTQGGLISGATVTDQSLRWATARGILVAGDAVPVLLHSDGSTPTEVTSFAAQERLGTIGRRLRR